MSDAFTPAGIPGDGNAVDSGPPRPLAALRMNGGRRGRAFFPCPRGIIFEVRKIKHLWIGVGIPLVLVFVGVLRLPAIIDGYREENDRKVIGVLKLLHKVEYSYAAYDADRNGLEDFWTGDVADLIDGGSKQEAAMGVGRGSLLPLPDSRKIAEADAAPIKPRVENPIPLHGYYFIAIERNLTFSEAEQNYKIDTDGSGNKVHNKARFAFCAYPAKYDLTHKFTFVMNKGGYLIVRDNGGEPILEVDERMEAELKDLWLHSGD